MPRYRSLVLPIVLGLAVASLTPEPAEAGAQARIRGVVTDSSGAPIAGATVELTTEEVADFAKSVETDADGRYSLLILDATRPYRVEVLADGYEPWVRDAVKVQAGDTRFTLDVELSSQDEAAARQREAVAEQPGYREYAEGLELLRAGDNAAACAAFGRAVEARPDLAPAWGRYAAALSEEGRLEEAVAAAERCLALDDAAVRCVAVMANATLDLGREEEHRRWLARYQELNPDDPASLYNQATPYLAGPGADDALAKPLLESCLEADPEFPPCLYEYAMLLLRTGDMAGAKSHLERYVEVDPEGEKASVCRETLQWL